MKRPSKPFVLGCLSGLIAGVLLPAAGLFVAAQFMKDRLVANKTAQLAPPPVLAQTPANLTWTAEDLSGAPVPMAGFEGKTLFLHFWHPGCLSCQSEIASLNRLHTALAGTDVAFAAVVVSDFDEVAETITKYGIEYPVYLIRQKLPDPFTFTATPATFVIGPAGTVAFSHLGAAQWDAPDMVAFVKAVAQTAPSS